MRFHPAALLLLLVLPLAVPAAADGDTDRLVALDDPAHPEHAATAAWWNDRSAAEQIALLRRALASNQTTVARTAAHAIHHPYLSSHELGRQVGLRLGDPSRPFDETADWGLGEGMPLGAPLLVAYVDRALRAPDEFSGGAIESAHRVTRGEHLQALLPLLERASPKQVRHVLFLITNTARSDREDVYRAAAARGTLYGLLRLRALRAGEPAPALATVPADVTAPPAGGGIPPAAIAIAKACERGAADGLERSEAERDAGEAQVDAGFWVRRWLLDCTPGEADIPFLQHVIDRALAPADSWPYYTGLVHWAMGHLARLPGPAGADTVRAWAVQRFDLLRAWYAAVAVARLGDRAPFDALRASADAGGIAVTSMPDVDLTWFVDRAEACRRATARLRRAAPTAIGDRHPLAPGPRTYRLRDLGLRVDDDDLRSIAEQLWAHLPEDGHGGVLRLARFHAHLHPASLTVPRASRLLAGLRAWLARESADAAPLHDVLDDETLDRVLGLCEVRDADGTRALLRWWATEGRAGRTEALERLARLGGSDLADALIARWSDEDAEGEERWLLGLVPGEAVTAFLRAKAPTSDAPVAVARGREAVDALHAWVLRAGVARGIAPLFDALRWMREDEGGAAWAGLHAAWAAALAGDPVVAVLRLAEVAPHGIHALGALDDPRVTVWLEGRRDARDRGEYWEATMARAGRDPTAARDVLGLIRAGRTWLLEDLQGGGLRHVPRDVLVHELTAALDTNCCLGWIAHVLLKEVHPWLPFEDAYGGGGTVVTRAYLAGHAWRHSEIFGGPVPAPR